MEKRTIITEILDVCSGSQNVTVKFLRDSKFTSDITFCNEVINNPKLCKLISSNSYFFPGSVITRIVNVYECIYVEIKWDNIQEKLFGTLKYTLNSVISRSSFEERLSFVTENVAPAMELYTKTLVNRNGEIDRFFSNLATGEISVNEVFDKIKGFFTD